MKILFYLITKIEFTLLRIREGVLCVLNKRSDEDFDYNMYWFEIGETEMNRQIKSKNFKDLLENQKYLYKCVFGKINC